MTGANVWLAILVTMALQDATKGKMMTGEPMSYKVNDRVIKIGRVDADIPEGSLGTIVESNGNNNWDSGTSISVMWDREHVHVYMLTGRPYSIRPESRYYTDRVFKRVPDCKSDWAQDIEFV